MRAGRGRHVQLGAAVAVAVVLGHTGLEPARADDVRPAYLDIEESGAGTFRVVWKVPIAQDVPARFTPSFPESCRATSRAERVETPTAVIRKWTMVCDAGTLAGATIGIDGLEATAMDALVRVRLADGSLHRAVLRPTERSTTVPAPASAADTPRGRVRSALQQAGRWWYAALLLLAWPLSLTRRAVRRGILLCTLALIAGSLCGHVLGGLPVRETLLGPGVPTDAEAKRVIRGLMLNTYRAFMLDDHEQVYDVLARSVDGEFLTEVYLQNREALRFDADEAALSLIDRLDVRSIESKQRLPGGAIAIVATWDAYGSVFHWGHVHFRCNAYTAELTLVPADGYWKLTGMQVLDQERVV